MMAILPQSPKQKSFCVIQVSMPYPFIELPMNSIVRGAEHSRIMTEYAMKRRALISMPVQSWRLFLHWPWYRYRHWRNGYLRKSLQVISRCYPRRERALKKMPMAIRSKAASVIKSWQPCDGLFQCDHPGRRYRDWWQLCHWRQRLAYPFSAGRKHCVLQQGNKRIKHKVDFFGKSTFLFSE